VGVVAVGRILRFDEVRGYGFIAPFGGGEDVFVHANDFGDQRHLVHPGMPVEYEAEDSDRGLKVVSVRIMGSVSHSGLRIPRNAGRSKPVPEGHDDGMCDVLTRREFAAEVTELLLQHVPSLTGGQIAQVRERLVDHAGSHGWIED
jgi:cold shock protein